MSLPLHGNKPKKFDFRLFFTGGVHRMGTRLDHKLGVKMAWEQGSKNQQSLGVNPGPQVWLLYIKLCHLMINLCIRIKVMMKLVSYV